MTLHPDFPASPRAILDPALRWLPANEAGDPHELIGKFAATNLVGALGIFLAAPVLATARVVGQFVMRKLLEPVE